MAPYLLHHLLFELMERGRNGNVGAEVGRLHGATPPSPSAGAAETDPMEAREVGRSGSAPHSSTEHGLRDESAHRGGGMPWRSVCTRSSIASSRCTGRRPELARPDLRRAPPDLASSRRIARACSTVSSRYQRGFLGTGHLLAPELCRSWTDQCYYATIVVDKPRRCYLRRCVVLFVVVDRHTKIGDPVIKRITLVSALATLFASASMTAIATGRSIEAPRTPRPHPQGP